MRTIREPQHRSSPVLGFRRVRIRGLVGGASAAAAAVIIALGATGGTYALLNSKATLAPSGTITAGSAALTVTGSPLTLTGLYPGATVYAPVTVTNTGNARLALRVDSLVRTSTTNSFSAELTVKAGVVANAAACAAGFTSAWTGTFAAATAGSLASAIAPDAHKIAPGAQNTVCVAVTLANTAPATAQGQSAAFTLTLGGVQP